MIIKRFNWILKKAKGELEAVYENYQQGGEGENKRNSFGRNHEALSNRKRLRIDRPFWIKNSQGLELPDIDSMFLDQVLKLSSVHFDIQRCL